MIIHKVQCEICTNSFPYAYRDESFYKTEVPDNWITLFEGNVISRYSLNFCSYICLKQWIQERGEWFEQRKKLQK